MRFSFLFRRTPAPAAQDAPLRTVAATPQPQVTVPPPKELPEDLDARVRLLGEWQVSEL